MAHPPSVPGDALAALVEPSVDSTPDTIDSVAFARLYGEPLFQMPTDLYIPPDALEIFLEAFEGPLDLLLYLIRKQNIDILDIPVAEITKQDVYKRQPSPSSIPSACTCRAGAVAFAGACPGRSWRCRRAR